jgi:hypothetical protein
LTAGSSSSAQPAQHGAADPGGHLAVLGQGAEDPRRDARRQREQRVSLERTLPEEGLVKRDAEAELIGALVGGLAQELLGRHVRGRAHERARARELVELVRRAEVNARREVGVVPRWDARRGGGGDVGDGAPEVDGAAAAVLALDLGRFDVAREAEVDDARAAVLVEQHVVGLEVPVHEPLGVGGREAAPRRDEDGDDLAPRALGRLEPGPHRATAQELGR